MNYCQPAIVAFRSNYLPAYKALYLRAYKAPDIYVPIRPYIYVPIRHLYICRETSTNQLILCKTNPILSAVGGLQMNVSIFLQMAYENKSNWTLGENKPNSNPIKPNLKRAQMNVSSLITKDYRKKDDFAVRKNKPNSKPISERPKNERKPLYHKGL